MKDGKQVHFSLSRPSHLSPFSPLLHLAYTSHTHRSHYLAQLVKWGTVERLIDKLVDPNCFDEQLAPMFFLCHSYFIGAAELLEKIIGMYPTLLILIFVLLYFAFIL
jgi:RasGEF N-terminal motif